MPWIAFLVPKLFFVQHVRTWHPITSFLANPWVLRSFPWQAMTSLRPDLIWSGHFYQKLRIVWFIDAGISQCDSPSKDLASRSEKKHQPTSSTPKSWANARIVNIWFFSIVSQCEVCKCFLSRDGGNCRADTMVNRERFHRDARLLCPCGRRVILTLMKPPLIAISDVRWRLQ